MEWLVAVPGRVGHPPKPAAIRHADGERLAGAWHARREERRGLDGVRDDAGEILLLPAVEPAREYDEAGMDEHHGAGLDGRSNVNGRSNAAFIHPIDQQIMRDDLIERAKVGPPSERFASGR